jgi:hypothetical protein
VKKRAWEKVAELNRAESASPANKADQEKIAKIKSEIKEEERKRRQIEQEYRDQIKQIEKRHEEEMKKMQPPKNLDEERKELLKSLTVKLDREVERSQRQHVANLEILESQHRSNLEREKILSEQHNQIIRRQLEQQIQIAELVRGVQGSSTKLESILKSNTDINETAMREKQKKVLELEKEVNEKLTNLVVKQRTYNDLEKKLDGIIREYDLVKGEKLKILERDQFELDEHTERYKVQENKLISDVTLLRLKVENQKDKKARIEELLKAELLRKENELEDEKTRYENEKQAADDQQREYEKKIQLKYLEIDERKKMLSENEAALIKKIQNLDYKYDTVNREKEALKYKMEQLDEERVKFEDKAYQAQQTSIKVFEESEFVAVHKKEYEEDRAELEKLRYELEAEKAHVRAEHLKLEQKRTEIAMRERMIDQLKLNKVQEDLEAQQRINQSTKPYYLNEPFSAVRSGRSEFNVKSQNVENFSPNKFDYNFSVSKPDKEEIKSREFRSAKVESKTKAGVEDKEVTRIYEKLNESVPFSKKEDAKEGFDFNSYDEENDSDEEDDDEN